MSHENVEIVRRAIGAWNSGDLDDDAVIEELFDSDVEWRPAAESMLAVRTYRGYDGVRRFRTDLFSAWDRYAIEAVDFVESGDQVAVITRIQARTREIEINEVWSALVTLRDGRIARFQGFATRDGAGEAAGLQE